MKTNQTSPILLKAMWHTTQWNLQNTGCVIFLFIALKIVMQTAADRIIKLITCMNILWLQRGGTSSAQKEGWVSSSSKETRIPPNLGTTSSQPHANFSGKDHWKSTKDHWPNSSSQKAVNVSSKEGYGKRSDSSAHSWSAGPGWPDLHRHPTTRKNG